MSSIPKSISLDESLGKDIRKYQQKEGLKSFSGAIHKLIWCGLRCRCSNRNNGGGVRNKPTISTVLNRGVLKSPPDCLGKPGEGFCEECKYKEKCSEIYVHNCSITNLKNRTKLRK